MSGNRSTISAGLLYGIAAYGTWGLFPLYWKQVEFLPAEEILCHRVLWSLVFAAVLLTATRRWPAALAAVRNPRALRVSLASGVLIAANWFIYIWAVIHGRVVESSLGYYMSPLANVALGAIFLREKLRPWQLAAIVLAATGVIYLNVGLHHLPGIALALCLSFSLYGLLRKVMPSGPLLGLFLETALLSPAALFLIGGRLVRHEGGFVYAGAWTSAWLIGGGVVTALPLLWFAEAARRLSLATLGLLQYLAPTVMFVLSVSLYHEPFTRVQMVAFGCIWIALLIYSGESLWRQRFTRAGPPADPALIPTTEP